MSTYEPDIPAPQHTVPGPTYLNPNADEEYTPPPGSLTPDDDDDPDDVGLDILDPANPDVTGADET